MDIERNKLLDMYRMMVRIRTFEEQLAKDFADGKIPGFLHLSVGQEANPAGACANLRADDIITTNHRGLTCPYKTGMRARYAYSVQPGS